MSSNYFDEEIDEKYWVSGVKKYGNDSYWAESADCEIDGDAVEEYNKIIEGIII